MVVESRLGGRPSAVTVAVFRMVPVAVGLTRTGTCSTRRAPARMSPTLHVMTPLRMVAPAGDSLTSVSDTGRRSVTTTLCAVNLLRLRTAMV